MARFIRRLALGTPERTVFSLIAAQLGVHACMTGVRVAVPLQALDDGVSVGTVGLLMALFATAPIVLALWTGRWVDRVGYHRPVTWAVAISVLGAALAAWSASVPAMAAAALLTGAGTNIGVIAMQRSAGQLAHTATERMKVFSWLGLGPSVSNVLGPVWAGVLIDTVGFRWAFFGLALLPLAALVLARRVPPDTPRPRIRPLGDEPSSIWRSTGALLRLPKLRYLLLLNWILASAWDLHSFLLPLLGHERGLSAATIGGLLGLFAASVTAVRVIIPSLAHRLTEHQVLVGAMVWTALVLIAYPLVNSAWLMALCAVLLGLSLGTVQPMIMSALHQITPHERHGQAIALRSMAINTSSTFMPLAFGALGVAVGTAALFYGMGTVLLACTRWVKRAVGDADESAKHPTQPVNVSLPTRPPQSTHSPKAGDEPGEGMGS